MSVGCNGHVEFKYQAGEFIILSNEKIDAMKKEYSYADIFQRGKK